MKPANTELSVPAGLPLTLTGLLAVAPTSHGEVTFDLRADQAFDEGGIGTADTLTEFAELIDVTFTTEDIIGADASLASGGVTHLTWNHGTNGMGIKSSTEADGHAGKFNEDNEPL